MDKKICYVSKKHIMKAGSEKLIQSLGMTINKIQPSEFMVTVWTNKPDVVIVDIDSVGEKGVISIESVLESEYIPTLYLYQKYHTKWANLVQNGHLLPKDKCQDVIKDLLINSTITGRHYNQISSNYETMKLMDEEFDHYLDAFMKARQAHEPRVIDDFLHLIYSDNFMMQQSPQWYLMIHQNHEDIVTWIFSKGSSEISHFTIENTDIKNYITKAAEAGIYVNFSQEAVSDINSLNQVIPQAVLDYFEKNYLTFDEQAVETITTFALNKTLYIGVDYIKPVDGYDLAIFKNVCDKINKLHLVKSNIVDLQESFIYTMDALARAAESKDDITGHHIKRVNDYSALLAREMGLDEAFINEIQIAAQMHDVGKISVSELILNKPGKLTNEEFEEMKKHTTYGAAIVGESYHLDMARTIAHYHHEKFDGSGYPEGLLGYDIPLPARIVALSDIYDALRSPRSYKDGFSHDKAYEIITVGDGRVMPDHFDPDVLEAFKRVHDVFKFIYDSNVD